jgi:hypothetical protein
MLMKLNNITDLTQYNVEAQWVTLTAGLVRHPLRNGRLDELRLKRGGLVCVGLRSFRRAPQGPTVTSRRFEPADSSIPAIPTGLARRAEGVGVRPLQGRIVFLASASVGFTYGYSQRLPSAERGTFKPSSSITGRTTGLPRRQLTVLSGRCEREIPGDPRFL